MKQKIENSIVLITGGTGTFGQAFLEYLLNFHPKEIRIISRDVQRQNILKYKFSQYENIKYFIGDIQNIEQLKVVMKGVDYVFHAAALKQVTQCEENPMLALNINVIGANNVIEIAIQNKVKKIICISTNKAVYPTSTMGISKSYMEKIVLNNAKKNDQTEICIARFCNLICSSNNAISIFLKQISNNIPLTITNQEVFRYFMTIKEAIKLVKTAFLYGKPGEIFIKNCKKCLIEDLAQAVLYLTKKEKYPVNIIGLRDGENKEDFLYSKEELANIKFKDGYLIITNQKNFGQNLKDEFFILPEIIKMIQEDLIYNEVYE